MAEEGDLNLSKVSKEMDTEDYEQRFSDEVQSKEEGNATVITETHESPDQIASEAATLYNELSDALDLSVEKFKQISLGVNYLECQPNLDNPPKDSSNIKETEKDSDQLTEKSESNELVQPSQKTNGAENQSKTEENVDDNEKTVQEMDKKVKELKSSNPPQNPMSPSLRKVRRAGQTPRAKSTPSRAPTSPPLTRSKSRELRLQSTPGNLEGKKGNENELNEEVKVTRGRQRQRKDL